MRKQLLIAGAIAIAAATTTPANADIGISVSIGEPGFYGQLDIGNYYPQPQVIYAQPVIITPVPHALPPIYLRVRAWEINNWRSYCGSYNACGRHVYFVQDRWYSSVYAPRYKAHHHAPPPKIRHDVYKGPVVQHDVRHDVRHDARKGPAQHDARRDNNRGGRFDGGRQGGNQGGRQGGGHNGRR
ncbi:MAG: hypothetical protein LBE24_00945 [Methylobacillus sp.]|jgi:hypothetical protein|nr:hypothetical protein [Methylobacillus sp.]